MSLNEKSHLVLLMVGTQNILKVWTAQSENPLRISIRKNSVGQTVQFKFTRVEAL